MYWIIEVINSIIFMFFSCVLLKKQKIWSGLFFFYFYLVGSLISLFFLYLTGMYSYYDFLEFNIKIVKKIVGINLGINIVLLIALLIIYRWTIRGRKSELIIVRGIRILPYCSVKYAINIIGTVFLLFGVIDNIMPQYGLWKIDDQNIQLEKYRYHVNNITNNEYGYPLWQIDDNPLDINALESKKKIVVIGDSFIWGDGCSNSNYLWWRQLQRKIYEDGYQDCTIIGVGKCGASTQMQLDYIKNTSIIEDLKPDMIIIGYVTNDAQYEDAEGNLVPKSIGLTDYFSDRPARWMKAVFPNITYLINQYLNDRYYNTGLFDKDTGFPYEQWELEIIRGTYLKRYQKETVDPLGELTKKLNIPVILVATPSIPSVQYYNEKYGAVLPMFEDVGIRVYNPLKKYISEYEKDEHYADGINIVNSHPGTATNVFLAEYVKELLKNDYKEYLGGCTKYNCISSSVNDWFPHAVMPQQKGSEIEFIYPASIEKNRFLYMPIKKAYIKLSFDVPININSIKIYGEMLASESGEIYATYENSQKGYDSQELEKLGNFKEGSEKVAVELSNITSLCIHIDIKSQYDRPFRVVLE